MKLSLCHPPSPVSFSSYTAATPASAQLPLHCLFWASGDSMKMQRVTVAATGSSAKCLELCPVLALRPPPASLLPRALCPVCLPRRIINRVCARRAKLLIATTGNCRHVCCHSQEAQQQEEERERRGAGSKANLTLSSLCIFR